MCTPLSYSPHPLFCGDTKLPSPDLNFTHSISDSRFLNVVSSHPKFKFQDTTISLRSALFSSLMDPLPSTTMSNEAMTQPKIQLAL